MPQVAAFSGVLYALCFPSTNFHFLAWFALVPLLALERPRFLDGFVAGLTAHLIIFFWMWKTFAAADVNGVTTFFSWLGLSSVLGLYFGFFTELYGRLKPTFFRPILVALVWVLLEQVRSVILTGFPWALFAHTQASNVPLLQWASYGGEHVLSFVLVLSNATLASLQSRRSRGTLIAAGSVALLIGGLWIGGMRIAAKRGAAMSAAPKFKVALLQANIDQYQKWDDHYEAEVRRKYEMLVEEAVKSKPDLIVWPESAVPGWFPNEKKYLEWVKGIAIKSKTPHLIGAVTSREGMDFNAAFLVDAKGNALFEYDKQHLVPFGEYIPFGSFLKSWVPYLGKLGSFDAGAGPVLFEVGNVLIAPNICYEAFFPMLIARSVQRGADIIVNITNDGWFLDTAAPEQHFVANLFRAAENGRPVVRAANTGVSAVVDANGRILFRSPMLTSGVYVVDVPLVRQPTFFSMLYSGLCPAN